MVNNITSPYIVTAEQLQHITPSIYGVFQERDCKYSV